MLRRHRHPPRDQRAEQEQRDEEVQEDIRGPAFRFAREVEGG